MAEPDVSSTLHLNLLLNANGGNHSAWRVADDPVANVLGLKNYIATAQAAERAKFDAVFLADRLAFVENPAGWLWSPLEPITTMSAVASHTERIGLIVTASTTFIEPYNLARMLGSLDHFSNGRVGWNIVNGYNPDAARNFGLTELPPREKRYDRMYEFIEVVSALWDSWDDDAIVADRTSHRYVDPEKVHRIDHVGEHFRVAGPFNVPRSPQGRPVYIQAGLSADNREFAGAIGEGVYTNLQSVEEGVVFTQDVKRRARLHGRNPSHVLVLPGLVPHVGSTMAEALRQQEEVVEASDPDGLLHSLNVMYGTQYAGLGMDDVVPASELPERSFTMVSTPGVFARLIRDRETTVRDLLRLMDVDAHRVLVGTPESIADDFGRWLGAGASDGFTIMPSLLPSGFEDFADQVVPVLQERGLFRREYEGETLRSHYGLPRPVVDRG
ncbi:LLM class flavin-dependent oxidoreductase [Subtercola sp. Z020]|uniref:NtaA/DmoA family FMN-dependent monooxygenase n=1 Tax=Subtercola sp. Z020 TaxID=2080582 RepID=UPI000CE7E527|nr:NtaA/DmoA family FMN-dependent monooxygenase [Subtercola sp. Z020]PPF88280.1 LLM class flavin-dependent oxidoreductase [Subtercola sp. Z020]